MDADVMVSVECLTHTTIEGCTMTINGTIDGAHVYKTILYDDDGPDCRTLMWYVDGESFSEKSGRGIRTREVFNLILLLPRVSVRKLSYDRYSWKVDATELKKILAQL